MKFTLIVVAILGLAVAVNSQASRRQVLDSATQGPNPQDIATPEPEYIDIDLPEPPRPAPVQARAPIAARAPVAPRPQVSAYSAIPAPEPIPAHIFSQANGYQYRRPVSYFRRTHRIRY